MKYRFLILILLIICSIFILEKKSLLSQEFDFNSLIDPNTGLPAGIQEQISIEQIPKIPNPGEQVFVRITSYLTDLNKARITWIQNGTVLSTGFGVVTQTLVAPENGRSSTIQIRIEKEEGGTITETIILNPAQVDLIYEAFTYAHPFFKGKKLYTSESVVEIIAIPHFMNSSGQRMSPTSLVYTWRINGNVQQNLSGYGRDSISIQGTLIERPIVVSVDVSAPNSSLIATNTIRLTSTKPEFVLYENNPVFGVMYEKAIQGKFLLERPQVDFEGVPYFFSANFKDDPNLTFSWFINNIRSANKSPNENYMILRNDKNQEGTAVIKTNIKHNNFLLQQTSGSIELNFKKIDQNTNNENFNF